MSGVTEEITKEEEVQGLGITTYWTLVAICGDIMSKAKLEWVEKAIAILEKT